MEQFNINVRPQYVRYTDAKEVFPNGQECPLHSFQKRMKEEFMNFPEFVILTAPTGTGKSYAFPFPVLRGKKSGNKFMEDKVRGLIVLPTNALIDELAENFGNTYKAAGVNVAKITGETLNRLEKKGFERWRTMLDIAEDNDLVITNPDIINYAMHGGYHARHWNKKTGREEFQDFLVKFDYVVFDEYHLYDEAQIANIMSLIYLRDLMLPGRKEKIRFLFASATPEEGLKKLLEESEGQVLELLEEITDCSNRARAIHGKLEVEFCCADKIGDVIQDKMPEIRKNIQKNIRVLLILDNLRSVLELSEELRLLFPNYNIYRSTGYVSKKDNQIERERLKQAHIILATNKAEVGVNYDVEYCIMQPGMFYQNFVQRFGRVARGAKNGKVVVALPFDKFNQMQGKFKENQDYHYYDFLAAAKLVLQSKKFYTETVPFYLGEYIWCIKNQIREHQEYETRKNFETQIEKSDFFQRGKSYQRYKILNDINGMIREMPKKFGKGYKTTYWTEWWQSYRDTYLTFRDASKVVEVIDAKLGIELEYSLDWILQHKEILQVKTFQDGKREIVSYVVGDLKERDKDIQYTVKTIPSLGAKENELLTYKDIVSEQNLRNFFRKSVANMLHVMERSSEPLDAFQMELLSKIIQLEHTFTRKRLLIHDISGNSSFL